MPETAKRSFPHNFSPGPGAIPEVVLAETREALREVPGTGLPLLGLGHRTPWFRSIVDEAEAHVAALLGLGPDHRVLFLQGGASLQFTMIPLCFLRGRGRSADYLRAGYWSAKAVPEAEREGRVKLAWDGRPGGYARLPSDGELTLDPGAAYFHYVSNETVEGLQFDRVPGLDAVPRCCDMSSDFLARPLDCSRFGLIYAHAQKNLGPSGVTVTVIRRDLLEAIPAGLPPMLDYRAQAEAGSVYNTPPVFAIYVTLLVLRWLRHEIGGLAEMEKINRAKAAAVYAALDAAPELYRLRAPRDQRSTMNATFTVPTPELEARLLAEASDAGITGIEGHRSTGGFRVSLYNAVTLDSARVLAGFLGDFTRRHG